MECREHLSSGCDRQSLEREKREKDIYRLLALAMASTTEKVILARSSLVNLLKDRERVRMCAHVGYGSDGVFFGVLHM